MIKTRWLFCFCLLFTARSLSAQSISYSPANIVAGCPVTFAASTAGTQYVWNFGPYANVSYVITGGGSDTSIYFTKAGTYLVTATVTSNCCGLVEDSVLISVGANPLNISLSFRPDIPVCQGTEMIFKASTSNYFNYLFFVDDTLTQSSAKDSMITYALFPGDSVSLIAYNGTCYTNPTLVYPVIKPVPVAPVLTSSNTTDSICGGDTVTYTATSGYDEYLFSNGSSLQDSSSDNVYVTNSLEQGNALCVKGYMNGCASLLSNIISITIKPSPLAILSVYPNSFCRDSLITDTIEAAMHPGSSYFFYWINHLVRNCADTLRSAEVNLKKKWL